jgi:tripartite-type tricarboxylate transporter receptor subunit TctC
MVEAGVKDCVFDPWFGVLVRAGTPRPIVDKLNGAIIKVLQLPDVSKQLHNQGADPYTMPPEQFDKYIRGEVVKLGKIVRESGAKAE